MIRFAASRLGLTVITLLLVSVIVFLVAQVLPGDVGRTMLGPYATAEQVRALNHRLGFDRPLAVQYADWIWGFVKGDWGQSVALGVPVRPVVLQRLGHSLQLAVFAFVLIVPFSIAMGVLAARRQGRALDRVVSVTGMSLIALPEFVGGVIVLVVFAVTLRWFPVSSDVPGANPAAWFRQFLMPSVPLMFVLFGYISRMARAGTAEVLASGYTRTAVLKGLPEHTVIFGHVLRNALLPTITVVAAQIGYLVGGLAVVETLFRYPGIGKLVVDSATSHDIPTLQACVLLIAALYMMVNLAADLLYGVLNPRIRVSSR